MDFVDRRAFVASLVAAVVVMVAPAAALAQGCDKVDPTELAFWDSIKSGKSIEEYKAYLDTYPSGCFAALARVRARLPAAGDAGGTGTTAPATPAACAKQDAADDAFWDSIKSSQDVGDFRAYLDVFPSGCHASQARARVKGTAAEGGTPPHGDTAKPAPAVDVEPLNRTSFAQQAANVREGPSTDAAKVATLAAGTEVTVTGQVRGSEWLRVARDGSDIGYVYGPLLAEIGPAAAPPASPAPGSVTAYAPPANPYSPYATTGNAYPIGGNPVAAEALRKCPAAGGAVPLYAQFDQAQAAFAQQFGPALSSMMGQYANQAAAELARRFGNRLPGGFNLSQMLQQALGSLQRDIQAMQNSAALRQQIEAAERRDLDALQACVRSRTITRQEAMAVVQEREAKLAEQTRATQQSRQMVQQRRVDYDQSLPPPQQAAQAPEQAQVVQAKAQYDQQAAATNQVTDAALLKQRAQLERSKALLSQA